MIASTYIRGLDSFPAMMGLARARSTFIENKKIGINNSVGNFSRAAILRLDLRFFNDRRFDDFWGMAEREIKSLNALGTDSFGGRPGGRVRF